MDAIDDAIAADACPISSSTPPFSTHDPPNEHGANKPNALNRALGIGLYASTVARQSFDSKKSVSDADPMTITPLQQILCSCSGAIVQSIFTTPLDVVKIRLQVQQKPPAIDPILKAHRTVYTSRGRSLIESLCLCSHCHDGDYGATLRSSPTFLVARSPTLGNPIYFNGALDAFAKIVRTEGLATLWSGLPTTLLLAVPATVIYFTVYDRLKYRMGYQEGNSLTLYVPVLAGSLARIGAATVISPLELIRTKMQSERLTYRQVVSAIQTSVRSNGPLFLMRGLGPSLLRDVPFSAIYWLSYESAKARHLRQTGSSSLGVLPTFVAGAVSGTLAAVLTLPFDVIKTHRQIELGQAASSSGRGNLTPTWVLIADLYRQNGISALYAGIIPRVVKVAPACAVMITIYEFGKSFFRERNQARNHLVSSSQYFDNDL